MRGKKKVPTRTYEIDKYENSDSSYDYEKPSFKQKKIKRETPINRFDLFDPPRKVEKDPFLKSISRKITLLTLRVSHIENRLADYETRQEIETDDHYLKDPPFAPPPRLPSFKQKSQSESSHSTQEKSSSLQEYETQIDAPSNV